MNRSLAALTLALLVSFSIISVSSANEIYSCKKVSEGTIKSDIVYGKALYGDEFERSWMAKQKSEILVFKHGESIEFENNRYQFIGSTFAYEGYYYHKYWGLIEVYDVRDNSITLFTSRSNGYQSQMSNFLEIGLWHCNK
jgi:hypothetical protein